MTLNHYLRKDIYSVAGYLSAVDAETIAALGNFQTENGIRGDLCEFGVHHGRLFFILAFLRQTGEKALPVDLFVDDPNHRNSIHQHRDKAFFQHSERLSVDLDDVVTANTLQLSPGDLFEHIDKARIISVDAGHLYKEVANDLKLAAAILSDDGVIVADDYFNIYWPDVTMATNDFLIEHEEFVPFLITPAKIYICKRHRLDFYRDFAEQVRDADDIASRDVELMQHNIAAIRMGRRGEWRRKLMRWL